MTGPFFAMGLALGGGGCALIVLGMLPRRLLLAWWFFPCVPIGAGAALVLASWWMS